MADLRRDVHKVIFLDRSPLPVIVKGPIARKDVVNLLLGGICSFLTFPLRIDRHFTVASDASNNPGISVTGSEEWFAMALDVVISAGLSCMRSTFR